MERLGFDADRYFVLFGTTVFDICVFNAEIVLKFVLFRTTECYIYDIFIILFYYEFSCTKCKLSFFRIDVCKINFDWNLAWIFNFDLSGQ